MITAATAPVRAEAAAGRAAPLAGPSAMRVAAVIGRLSGAPVAESVRRTAIAGETAEAATADVTAEAATVVEATVVKASAMQASAVQASAVQASAVEVAGALVVRPRDGPVAAASVLNAPVRSPCQPGCRRSFSGSAAGRCISGVPPASPAATNARSSKRSTTPVPCRDARYPPASAKSTTPAQAGRAERPLTSIIWPPCARSTTSGSNNTPIACKNKSTHKADLSSSYYRLVPLLTPLPIPARVPAPPLRPVLIRAAPRPPAPAPASARARGPVRARSTVILTGLETDARTTHSPKAPDQHPGTRPGQDNATRATSGRLYGLSGQTGDRVDPAAGSTRSGR
jgi:hypothetical protein